MGILDQLRWAFDFQGLSATEKAVLVALAYRANKQGQCWPSVTEIGRMVGLTPSAVSRVIQRLTIAGCIQRTRRFSRSNVYSLQYMQSAVCAQQTNCTEASQFCASDMSVCSQAQSEVPRKDHKNRPIKKRSASFVPDLSKIECSEQRREALAEWLEYKKQKGQKYVELGWKKFLTTHRNLTDEAFRSAINKAIEKGWSGIFPENASTSAPSRFQPQAPRQTFTENSRMPPEAFLEIDLIAERRATLARREEELNGRREVAR